MEAKDSGMLDREICFYCPQYQLSCNGYEFGSPVPFNPPVIEKKTATDAGTLITSSIRMAKPSVQMKSGLLVGVGRVCLAIKEFLN